MTALAYFGPQFFETLVGGGSQDLLITGLYGAEKFIMVGIFILFFSERWGRKPTLWISAVLMSLCFIIVTVVNNTTPAPVNNNPTSAGIATVAMIFITNSIYQFSWGPLPWPYTAEVSTFRLTPSTRPAANVILIDLPIPYPRGRNICRRLDAVALQFLVQPYNTVHDRGVG